MSDEERGRTRQGIGEQLRDSRLLLQDREYNEDNEEYYADRWDNIGFLENKNVTTRTTIIDFCRDVRDIHIPDDIDYASLAWNDFPDTEVSDQIKKVIKEIFSE